MSDVVIVESEDRLLDALTEFTGCVGEALDDICSYGLTIGETYVPFDPDEDDDTCEAEEAMCSQVWVRVTEVNPNQSDCWGTEDCEFTLSIGLEVGVLRCIEIASGGEAPSTSEVLAAAMQAMSDMRALYRAAMSCDVWDGLDAGQWSPSGPLGGQYGGTWTFTAEV